MKIGVSKAMFFAYRKGTHRVTPKVWLRLERVEREAGIGCGSVHAPDPAAESETKVKDFEAGYPNESVSVSARLAAVEAELRLLRAAVLSLLPQAPPGGTLEPSTNTPPK